MTHPARETSANDNLRDQLSASLILDRCIASCDRVAALAPVIDDLRDDIAKLIAEIRERFPQAKTGATP